MEYKLDVKIFGVKSRVRLIADLLERLNLPRSCVYIDQRGPMGANDCWGNAKRAWSAPIPEGVTHRLVISDDAVTCNNFLQICNKIINVFPDVIWTLYSGLWIPEKARKNDCPYVNVRGCKTGGLAIIMPVEHIPKMVAWSDSVLGEDYRHDDGRIGFYALCNDVKLYSTIPSLTDHLPVDSVIRGHNDKRRVAKAWIGEDIGYQDWDNREVNNTPLVTNDVWIFTDQERKDRIMAVINAAKKRLREAEREEAQRCTEQPK